ncbi:MAG: peptidoglycan-binding protein [Clostridium sp.]|nr:peptidoglycan-binding protein [Clostridium sp.]
MGKGYILIQLSKEQEALPITNAKIKIRYHKTKEVMFETNNGVDESGRSQLIELDAPDKDLSLNPMNETYIPYARYDVSVDSEGYNTVIIEGVSIFDETTSIQNVSLTEIVKTGADAFYNSTEDRIVIPPHQLLLDVQRDQKTGVLSQPFVLREVYIPEYITVHLGAPSAWAQNVTVRFVDYIKNVASHEIYPTWPEQSLRANIYAQITFALNRVYTEWYVSRGYSFQITNSTAYDQYFVNGGNVFENVSKIVDSIFNEYFSIVNSNAPYFTQYCNGTTAKCNGLSQWGTVDLANNGKTALQILQYYYGNDKILKRTPIIAGLVESYPGVAIRRTNRNSNVTIIQQQLNRISQNYPAIPKLIPVDGIFGPNTEASVKVFQRVFNLVQDGIVGRATWYKLSAIYTAVKRLGELDQEVEQNIIVEDLNGNLNGDYQLESLKYGSNCSYVDLEEIYSVEDLTRYPGYVLKKNFVNKDVRRLKTMLAKISSLYEEIPEVNVDRDFDEKTKNAVIKFQKTFGLSQTGDVDINTWRNIVFVYLSLDSGRNINTSDILFPFPFELKLGDNNGYVAVLKEYMNVLARNGYNIRILPIDNIFDSATERNVKNLQKVFDLRKTGVVDKVTWNKIASTYNDFFTGRK